VFFHELRQDSVLGAEPVLQVGDAALGFDIGALGLAVGALEGGGAVFKELLEPAVEDRRLELGLVAKGGDRDLLDKVAAEEGHLLLRRERLPGAFHWGVLPAQFYGTDTPFPTEALHWDQHLVRLFHADMRVAVHRRIGPGQFAPRPGATPFETTSTQRAFEARLLARCARVGDALREWADEAVQERGVRAYRVIQGVLGLTRTQARDALLDAVTRAVTHRLFRYKDVKRLTEQAAARRAAPVLRGLTQEHDSIRSMTAYRLENFVEELP
jgi:hypothetical protein